MRKYGRNLILSGGSAPTEEVLLSPCECIQVLYKLSWMTQPIRGVCHSRTHVSVELPMQTLTQHIVSVLPSNWRSKRSDRLKTAHVM